MAVARTLAIIAASGAAFAVVGGGLGYGLATVAPAYYRAVFRTGEAPWFDPVQVAIGLGVTQGLVAGLVVGGVAVIAAALSVRRDDVGGPAAAAERPTP